MTVDSCSNKRFLPSLLRFIFHYFFFSLFAFVFSSESQCKKRKKKELELNKKYKICTFFLSLFSFSFSFQNSLKTEFSFCSSLFCFSVLLGFFQESFRCHEKRERRKMEEWGIVLVKVYLFEPILTFSLHSLTSFKLFFFLLDTRADVSDI